MLHLSCDFCFFIIYLNASIISIQLRYINNYYNIIKGVITLFMYSTSLDLKIGLK